MERMAGYNNAPFRNEQKGASQNIKKPAGFFDAKEKPCVRLKFSGI